MVGQLIGDPSHQTWTAAQVQSQLNSAQEKFVIDTRAYTNALKFSVTADPNVYAFTTAPVEILRVTLNGVPLIKTSKRELDNTFGTNWVVTKGTPTRYFIDIQNDVKSLGIYPAPTGNDVGVDNLECDVIFLPVEMVLDNSYPFTDANGVVDTLMNPYHDALAYDAACYFKSIMPDQQALMMVGAYKKAYNETVSKCIENLRAMGQTTPLRMMGGRNHAGL